MAEQQKDSTVNVLLVDDDVSLRQVAELILKDMDQNLAIDSVASVEEAYNKLGAKAFDIIVCDYEMPEKNGLDFLRELRQQNNSIPFILFTGKGREEIAIQALNLGADRYLNKSGNPETVYKELAISIHQLHGRAKAQDMLKENEERLRLLIDYAPDPVVVFDTNGVILDINRQTEALLGFKKSEILGKSMITTGIVPVETMHLMSGDFNKATAGTTVNSIEYTLKRKNGSIVIMEISAFPIKRRGKIEILSIGRDVTQRKNTEAELEQKFEVLERVAKSIDSGLAIIGKDYRVVWANSILQRRITDQSKHCYQLFNNLDTVCPNCGVKAVFEENASLDVHEFEFLDYAGKRMVVELRVTPLKDKNGEVVGAIELGVPVTERKKAEQELKESKERYAKLSEAAVEGILISRRGTIVDANSQFSTMHGYQVNEIVGKPAVILVDPKDREQVKKNMLDGFEGPYELLGLRKDGSTFPVEVRAKSIIYEGALARVSAVLDITDRKKQEEQLRILSTLFELASDAIFVCDTNGKIVYFNEATYKTANYTKEEMAKLSLYEFCSPNMAQLIKTRIQMILKNKSAVFESEHLRKDKSIIPCEVSARVIESNESKLILNVARDVTERKKAEAGLAAVNEKLRVVGKLTRHDVRNKLTTISSNTYLLRKRFGSNPDIVRYLDGIDSAVALSNRLFDFTSVYEKIGGQIQAEIDVKRCFDEAVALFPNIGNVSVNNESQGLVVVADSLLRQIFYNLIDNSLKHGKAVTKIHLYYKKDQNGLKLYYEDNGVGVSADNKQNIFAEHFTTNGGTGLGMSMIRKIMEVYNWTIEETGVPGQGVTFEISIPAATSC